MLSAGRRDKQKEQERPHRPRDGGDELRGRTDPVSDGSDERMKPHRPGDGDDEQGATSTCVGSLE